MSSGSPTISDRTMENTRAGAHSWANRPPLTALTRLRRVLISTISAPQRSSWPVKSASSSGVQSGFSNSAEPPPEISSSTQSFAPSGPTRRMASSVAANEFRSGTGCPASRMRRPGISPRAWPYLVMTMPSATASPRYAAAAAAICHAALPSATSTRRPSGGARCASARCTAASGKTAWIAASMMRPASSRMVIRHPPFPRVRRVSDVLEPAYPTGRALSSRPSEGAAAASWAGMQECFAALRKFVGFD